MTPSAEQPAPQAHLDPDDARKVVAMLSMTATIRQRERGRRGVRGEIPCTACGTGTLRYSIAQFNGHLWAQCTTDGCVGWIE